MNKKTWRILATVLAAIAMALCVSADTEVVDGITWTYAVSDGKSSVEPSYLTRFMTGAVSIPATLGGCPVTSIGNSAFKGCTSLTAVTIPAEVTNIGDFAFSGCVSLSTIGLPRDLKSIGNYAFNYCTGLESVAFPPWR